MMATVSTGQTDATGANFHLAAVDCPKYALVVKMLPWTENPIII